MRSGKPEAEIGSDPLEIYKQNTAGIIRHMQKCKELDHFLAELCLKYSIHQTRGRNNELQKSIGSTDGSIDYGVLGFYHGWPEKRILSGR